MKIPLKYAKVLGLTKSFLVRVNQGKRRLSLETAIKLIQLAEDEGEPLSLLDLRPDLQPLIPYLCKRKKKRK